MIDLADIANRIGHRLTKDKAAVDFFGGRLTAFGDMLVWISTERPTSEEAGRVIRLNAEFVISWDSVSGNLTCIVGHPRKLADLIQKIRDAETKTH